MFWYRREAKVLFSSLNEFSETPKYMRTHTYTSYALYMVHKWTSKVLKISAFWVGGVRPIYFNVSASGANSVFCWWCGATHCRCHRRCYYRRGNDIGMLQVCETYGYGACWRAPPIILLLPNHFIDEVSDQWIKFYVRFDATKDHLDQQKQTLIDTHHSHAHTIENVLRNAIGKIKWQLAWSGAEGIELDHQTITYFFVV